MAITVNSYSIEELCNENKQIIIRSQKGIEIGITPTKEGTELRFYFGNEVQKKFGHYLIKTLK